MNMLPLSLTMPVQSRGFQPASRIRGTKGSTARTVAFAGNARPGWRETLSGWMNFPQRLYMRMLMSAHQSRMARNRVQQQILDTLKVTQFLRPAMEAFYQQITQNPITVDNCEVKPSGTLKYPTTTYTATFHIGDKQYQSELVDDPEIGYDYASLVLTGPGQEKLEWSPGKIQYSDENGKTASLNLNDPHQTGSRILGTPARNELEDFMGNVKENLVNKFNYATMSGHFTV